MNKIKQEFGETIALHLDLPNVQEQIIELKAEIRRVNQLIRENHNPHTYRQNKKYLERLERKLRQLRVWN